jgi:ATP/maltotriose-dependent transcriptional regulator MalT
MSLLRCFQDRSASSHACTSCDPAARAIPRTHPRLVDATSQLSEKRLAVVKGPAGFGKTSLAVTWLQRLQQSGNAVAWLTIDTDDDEPAIFLFYLAHALQHASEGVGATAIDLIQESFLINPRAIALVPSDMKLLHEKTEGWPAALRIVVSTSIQSRQGIAQYVRKLSGSQRPIGAYLEDMLDGLPRDMVQFMLRTAILDRLCAPLCEALAGASSGPEWLGSIEKRQLLLVPLDQESHWYRYHPLLAEYLSQRLASELGNEIPGLHQRAALWYASQELWSDAVQHAIAAGDAVRALSWMENCAMPLVKRGDLFTLLGWQRLSHPCSCGVSPRSGLRSPGGWHSPSGMTRRSSSRVK